MTPEEIEQLFTRSTSDYVFARWGRPIAPVIFGVDDRTLATFKGAAHAVAELASIGMTDTDPELGVNMMVFFAADWAELRDVPDLDKLIPELGPLVDRLIKTEANQYRIFRFDEAGAIKACFVFLRISDEMADVPADRMALVQMVQSILLWSDTAFDGMSPLVEIEGQIVLRPELGVLVRAAYDPALPATTKEKTHAFRLAARVTKFLSAET